MIGSQGDDKGRKRLRSEEGKPVERRRELRLMLGLIRVFSAAK
jgi:hypothetical protein